MFTSIAYIYSPLNCAGFLGTRQVDQTHLVISLRRRRATRL